MYQAIIVVHVLLGLGIVGLVLMQQGKGADAGAAFGSGSSGSVFGAQGAASFLSRTTAVFATLFFLTSLGLAILAGHQNKPDDIMDMPVTQEAPATQNVKEDVPDVNGNAPDTEKSSSLPMQITEQKGKEDQMKPEAKQAPAKEPVEVPR